MKRNVFLRFVLSAFCAIFLLGYAHAQTENLIPNTGGMESGQWTGTPNGSGLTLSFPQGEGLHGSTALKSVTSQAPTSNGFYVLICEENFKVTPGRKYTVSFWAKASKDGMRVQPFVQRISSEGNESFPAYNTFELTQNWKQYRHTVTADTPNGANLRLRLRGFDVGIMHIDNVQIGLVDYEDVPQSGIYEVTLSQNSMTWPSNVFINHCPSWSKAQSEGAETKDQSVLNHFAGRSISWTKFCFNSSIKVHVKITDTNKVPLDGKAIRVLPSRYGVTGTRLPGTNIVEFTITEPAQYSLEIGGIGYENGLMIFADPVETDIPSKADPSYRVFKEVNANLNNVVIDSQHTGVYFCRGVHNIGAWKIPTHVKNVYFEDGSWVYGTLQMVGNPDVRIYGRGVLSSAKMNYRQAHCVEAIEVSPRITLEGLVVADPKYFAVRLTGNGNTVSYTKIIGGWVYNCDGIAAYAGSTVKKCFIWANDDAIKIYRSNIHWEDIVVWQLNNGGIIQMSWGGPLTGNESLNSSVKRLDVLRAEWNVDRFNIGLLNCVGNRYGPPVSEGGRGDDPGKQSSDRIINWLIEDVKTENPIPLIWNITPDTWTRCDIDGLTMRNWDVEQTNLQSGFQNRIVGWSSNSANFFRNFTFDNVRVNGGLMTNENRIISGEMDPGARSWLLGNGTANHTISFCNPCGTGDGYGLWSQASGTGNYVIACNDEICIQNGESIVISFWAHANGASGKQLVPFLQNTENGQTVDFPAVNLHTGSNYQRYANLNAVQVNLGSSDKYKLRFRGTTPPANIYIDKVQVGRKDWRTLTNIQIQNLNTPNFLPTLSSSCEAHIPTDITSVVEEKGLAIYQSAPGIMGLKGVNENIHYKVYSVTGNMVLSGQGTQINVSELVSGIYILATDENERIKFTKN